MNLAAFVGRLASTSRFIAALLVCAASLRFAFVAVQTAFASPAPRNSVDAEPVASAVPSPSAPVARRVDTKPEDEKPLRVTLSITVGPGRSEVIVNGRRMGRTPFVGDVSCKQGHKLRIEVVPADGPVIRLERVCRGANILINRTDDIE